MVAEVAKMEEATRSWLCGKASEEAEVPGWSGHMETPVG